MNKIKKITHAIAGLGGAALLWAYSDKGQAVLASVYHAYPKTTIISTILGFIAVVYHSPKQAPAPAPQKPNA